jgi:hypothetical protein
LSIYLLVVDDHGLAGARGRSLDALLGARLADSDMVSVYALGAEGGTIVPGMPAVAVGTIHWPATFGPHLPSTDGEVLSFAIADLRRAHHDQQAMVTIVACVDPHQSLPRLQAAARSLPRVRLINGTTRDPLAGKARVLSRPPLPTSRRYLLASSSG